MVYLELARRRRGLTQWQLAKRAQVSGGMIALLENQRATPSAEQRARLAHALGVSPARLLVPVVMPDEECEAVAGR